MRLILAPQEPEAVLVMGVLTSVMLCAWWLYEFVHYYRRYIKKQGI